jgi:hypothetical protein
MQKPPRFLCSVIALAVLAGCAQPVISDINDSSLRVVQRLGTPMEQVHAEAKRGCNIYGKTPMPISHKCLDGYCFTKQHLYARQ